MSVVQLANVSCSNMCDCVYVCEGSATPARDFRSKDFMVGFHKNYVILITRLVSGDLWKLASKVTAIGRVFGV